MIRKLNNINLTMKDWGQYFCVIELIENNLDFIAEVFKQGIYFKYHFEFMAYKDSEYFSFFNNTSKQFYATAEQAKQACEAAIKETFKE